jgi:hypothetical protein
MSITCPSNTALTDTELDQIYSNGVKPGILPSSPNDMSDRDGNGMLIPSAINTIISSLKNSGILSSTNSKKNDNNASLIKDIQNEYCFYYSRYKYSLEKLLGAIRQGYTTNTNDTQQVIQKYLASTQALNRRLNDLIQIVNEITNDIMKSSSELSIEAKTLKTQMNEQKKKLDTQNKIISSSEATSKLNKEMVKFTEEKARYSDNLLKLYSVVNIVALGLLVYVYKSTAD